MDELASRCQKMLESFRLKELKDVLTRIGAAKQGKKQILIDKIMAAILVPDRQQTGWSSSNRHGISREDVIKIVDDVYRKMHGFSAPDLATTVSERLFESITAGPSAETESAPRESKTRCPCGSSMDAGTMIQCDDPKCSVWQHISCVLIPEKEGMEHEIPSSFYCETCRIEIGDPFCVTLRHSLLPTKLTTSSINSEGSSPLQSVEKSFRLSRNDIETIHKPNHDLQIWSLLLNDKVAFRMHWPLHVEVRVNGFPIRVTNRPGHQSLGINGRDDGARIADYVREGTNNISLTASDGRPFCVGVRMISRLSVDQVLSRIPSEAEGESFDMALARVRRCIAGGSTTGKDNDSDSDLEVVSECVSLSVRCPMSGLRMKVAGRFRHCAHMGCFDLHTFVEMNQRTRKWQCPICLTNYSLGDLIIDPFFTRIAKTMRSYAEDITEIELKPDGFWRAKREGASKNQEPWRLPDGSLTIPNNGNGNTNQSQLVAVKVEEGAASEKVPFKIGFKRSRDGSWQVNEMKGFSGLSSNGPVQNQLQKFGENSLSRSTTGASSENDLVNQGPNQLTGLSERDDTEAHSALLKSPVGNSEHVKSPEFIVLSDTDDENMDEHTLIGGAGTLTEAEILTNEKETSVTAFSDVDSPQENTVDFLGMNKGDLVRLQDHTNVWSSHQDSTVGTFGSVSDASMEASNQGYSVHPMSVQTSQRLNYGLANQQLPSGRPGREPFEYARTTESLATRESLSEVQENSMLEDTSLNTYRTSRPIRASAAHVIHEPARTSRIEFQNDWISLGLYNGENTVERTADAGIISGNTEQTSQAKRVTGASASALVDQENRAFTGDSISGPKKHRSLVRRRYLRVDSDSD